MGGGEGGGRGREERDGGSRDTGLMTSEKAFEGGKFIIGLSHSHIYAKSCIKHENHY